MSPIDIYVAVAAVVLAGATFFFAKNLGRRQERTTRDNARETAEQMSKRIEELRVAADPKRSGLQGEVLEREIEDVLIESFPSDVITPVKAGKRGADVLQRVRSPRGLDCGAKTAAAAAHESIGRGFLVVPAAQAAGGSGDR